MWDADSAPHAQPKPKPPLHERLVALKGKPHQEVIDTLHEMTRNFPRMGESALLEQRDSLEAMSRDHGEVPGANDWRSIHYWGSRAVGGSYAQLVDANRAFKAELDKTLVKSKALEARLEKEEVAERRVQTMARVFKHAPEEMHELMRQLQSLEQQYEDFNKLNEPAIKRDSSHVEWRKRSPKKEGLQNVGQSVQELIATIDPEGAFRKAFGTKERLSKRYAIPEKEREAMKTFMKNTPQEALDFFKRLDRLSRLTAKP